jgi:hypothetical protein
MRKSLEVMVGVLYLAWSNAALAHGSNVSAETECRAGCQGNKAGCQESYKAAVIAARPGMRLYRESLTMSRSWPGGDTSALAAEPQWDISFVPADDPRPVSVTIKPVLTTCIGRDAHKQSRTHYEWTAVQGYP